MKRNLETPTETVLSIYLNIIDGKIPYHKTALLEIDFSGTANDTSVFVIITIDGDVAITKQLSTDITNLQYRITDTEETKEHELRIEVRGKPSGAMLHLHRIAIEGLDMRLTMEDSGTCELDGQKAIPSEYMGQVGYQSLKFTTPICPWLLTNEQKDSYYYRH